MHIEVNYNPDNRACSTLGHFESNWIHNDTLHPKLKEIPYTLVEGDKDEILLLNDDFEIVETFDALRLDALSTYILGE